MQFSPKTKPVTGRNVFKTEALKDQASFRFMQQKTKIYFLLGLSLLGIIAIFFVEPIPQDHGYHNFADSRTLLSIPNFWNVVSNLPFLIFGVVGLASIIPNKPQGQFPGLKAAYLIFFTGIFFTGIGSAYYHFSPNNSTLLWDRLPMTIAFMAFFSIIIGEFISLKKAQKLLFPLLLVGAASVFYWYLTELAGHGDLRFYALIQFLPILLIPLIMLLFRSGTDTNLYTWLVILAYLVAKIFETFDEQIFETIHLVSGHTLKHLAASLAPLLFLIGLSKRRIILPHK